jgi:hypothetical protein
LRLTVSACHFSFWLQAILNSARLQRPV